MPLTDQHKHLLHELFEIPYEPAVVYVGEHGLPLTQAILDPLQSPVERLRAAIISIDADETKVARVGAILEEWEKISLDPSSIERNGYSFRFTRSRSHLRRLLAPYTGLISPPKSNAIKLG